MPTSRHRRRWLLGGAVLVAIAGVFFMFVTRSDMWLDETLSLADLRPDLPD